MGKDCYNIYKRLPLDNENKEKIKSILDALEEYFKPNLNVTYERFIFNTCDQQNHESIDEYVNKLRGLSETCEFGTLRDSLIKDRIVLGTKNKQVQVTLLNQKDLTLDKALSLCRNSELTEQHLIRINDASTVRAVQKSIHKKEKERKLDQISCEYCGLKHAKRKCPAYGKTCRKCNKKNHFANVCKTKVKSAVKCLRTSSDNDVHSETDDLFCLTHDIGSINSKGKRWFVTIEMQIPNHEPQLVKCQLDTGSTCNTISYQDFCKICSDESKLKDSNVKLKLYDGTILTPRGQNKIQCRYKDKSLDLLFQVVEGPLVPLLSAEACEQLGLLQMNFALYEENLISKFPEVFQGLGCLPGSYEIATDPSIPPVKHVPRKVPVSMKARLKEELDRLVELQVIAPVKEPTDWISSMICVKKPNKLRICLDPKDLNKAIKRPNYPIPNLDDVLAKLSKAKFFSVVDCKDGFWQVKLTESSSFLTTFWTPFGRFRWLRMPFGISSAPEEFQRRLHEITAGLTGVEVIADDILIYGTGDTEEQASANHDQNMINLLERAKENNLKFNPKKLKLRQKSIAYMGHLLTTEGLKPDPSKVEAIQNMPELTNVNDVQRFIGFVNYLSRFLPKLSDICEPLRRLTDKNAEWLWTKVHNDAVETIKHLISREPLLSYYRLEDEVTIQCDASQTGLGTVLLQNGQPVAYSSRSLTKTEQRYAQIEKECLAIVFSCERFSQYLLGRNKITVESDHKPLETIFKKPLFSAPKRLQRMLLRLQGYQLNVKYKQGYKMYIADFLSRSALPLTRAQNNGTNDNTSFVFANTDYDVVCDSFESVNFSEDLAVTTKRYNQIETCTAVDETLQVLKSVVLNGWPESKRDCPKLIHQYWSFRDEITTQNGILYKGQTVIIPTSMRREMLEAIHYSHLGIASCLRRARDVLFWPGMSAQVKDFISKCSTCNEYSYKQPKEPLLNHSIPTRPWSKLAIDLFVYNNVNYVILVDYFSDFWEVAKLNDTTSSSVIEFCKQQFSRHGIPDILVSDNGPQLISSEFVEFSKAWQFNHVKTSPYHSQSNGKAESAVKIAKGIIKKSLRDKKDFWLSILDWRNTPTENMSLSPVQRLFSRRTKTILPTTSVLLAPSVLKESEVTKALTRKRSKAKFYYDRNAHSLRDLRINEFVRVQPLNSKQLWKLGKVVLQYAPRSYVVEVDGKLITRNRKFLRTTSESPIVMPEFDISTNSDNDYSPNQDRNVNTFNQRVLPQYSEFGTTKHTRTRTIRPPSRYQDYVMN